MPILNLYDKEGKISYRKTFEEAPVGIAHVNLDGRFIKVNDFFSLLLGYEIDEFLNLSIKDITFKEEVAFEEQLINDLVEKKRSIFSFEKEFIKKDGNKLSGKITVSLTFDKNEKPEYLIYVLEDITIIKKAQLALQKSEESFRNLLEASPHGIIIINQIEEIVFVSSVIEKLFGFESDSILGMNIEVLIPKTIEKNTNFITNIFNKNSFDIYSNELIANSKYGFEFPINVNYSIINTPNGELVLIAVDDISFRKASEKALQESETTLKKAQKIAQIGNWTWDFRSNKVSFSEGVIRIFGLSDIEYISKLSTVLNLVHPDEKDKFKKNIYIAFEKQLPFIMEHRIVLPNKSVKTIKEIGELQFDENDNPTQMMIIAQDVSERKEYEGKQVLAENILENSKNGVMVTDAFANILYVNKSFTSITGYTYSDAHGKNPKFMNSGRHSLDFFKSMWQSIQTTGFWEGEVWNRKKNGEIFPKWLRISTIKDENAKVLYYVGNFDDLSELKENEKNIQKLTYYDILTNLPNQFLLRDRLDREILKTNNDTKIGVIFINVDNFKRINDGLGYKKGDEVLIKISERISESIQPGDTVGRISADEFLIILSQRKNINEIINEAEKILHLGNNHIAFDNKELKVTLSLGISVFPEDGENPEELIKNSMQALHHTKSEGKNNFQFYSNEMNLRSFQKLETEIALSKALENKEFFLFYQPQIDVKTQKIIGAEALIRWRHPARGVISPFRFIPVAEETKLITPIGEWVIKEAIKANKKLQLIGLKPITIAINISAVQFKEQDLFNIVKDTLKSNDLNPEYLDIEITESVIVDDLSNVKDKLIQFKELGVKISIDDFGTGYSSLSYIKNFPIDKLKIDMAFIKEYPENDDGSIAKTIIELGHNLKLHVIAEGVEKENQFEFLKKNGCDEIQGYYFSHPVDEEELIKMIKEHYPY